MKQYQFIFFICLSLHLIESIHLVSTFSLRTPRKLIKLHSFARLASTDTKDIDTFFYKQTLDHFNYKPESYNTFDQRYLINFKYWGGANYSAPIFVYLGAEDAIDPSPYSVGFMIDNAPTFKALLVYIEHRYYGKSIPFGSREEAYKNASTLGYLNSAQALADYADVIIHIKKTLQAQNSPIVVIGGSYGGMLASWFRLKYPHLTIGALASSAPILSTDDIVHPNAYMDVVSRDFKEVSDTCYETILNSWSEIDRVTSETNGLSILSKKFNTCSPLNNSSELSHYLENMYVFAAQYNHPSSSPVTTICNGIDKASFGNDVLDKIYSGIVAFIGNDTCQINDPTSISETPISETDIETETRMGWGWQICSELVVRHGIGNDTMFRPSPFDLEKYISNCKEEYDVSPRSHWISTYYGGHNLKTILQRFGSNIIFSNGLQDPLSSGGILHDLSKSIVAIYTKKGSHCLDIQSSSPSDPVWLIKQRKQEVKIIKRWIAQYYTDLDALH
ncbi:unnamed protein product [Lathyrus oleraceus]|uniref:Lysosomal Pro-X carboxypeptidase n=1 Tax=Pisum sativum TaxID=3888 RepID=A0A9D5H0E9_PEA|nr:hypothetical protein KIW84_015335 [Pisum sativum]